MPALPGFSKLNVSEKLSYLSESGVISREILERLMAFNLKDPAMAELFGRMTENVISSYPLPYSIAPGFLINGQDYSVPMVTEESSVVAAASWSARFWAERGGFKTHVISETKIGQIHFIWGGDPDQLRKASSGLFGLLKSSVSHLTGSMEKRGGGITGFELIDLTSKIEGLYQVKVSFGTGDSMGANFINSCLEEMKTTLCVGIFNLCGTDHGVEIIMAILSNHTPDCRVTCTVECSIEQLAGIKGAGSPEDFARRFELAVRIAQVDPYRAVTHNKGIFNGIDAVVLATANDFRAVEAAGHAYASHTGQYSGLTDISLDNGRFQYTLEVPMAVGTTGGLTRTHPLATASLAILGNPGSSGLMQIAAATGLANNFSAIKALITTGIQAGHMPLHNLKTIKTTRYIFQSHAKLLLTGEYLVLSGAKALALPLRQGQSMQVEFTPGTPEKISWSASDPDGIWFEAELVCNPELTYRSASDTTIARRLVDLLNAARRLNSDFLTDKGFYLINTHMTFRKNWGWGSSSTLISNIAWWANVDPFALNRLVSKGSGYDIACARSSTPIFYRLQDGLQEVTEILFQPLFSGKIAFIFLGRKQDTNSEINSFSPDQESIAPTVQEVSEISSQIATTSTQRQFNKLMDKHESILSKVLNRPPVRELLFPDFDGSIKSLGAWGGDFILASSPRGFRYARRFFEGKGYPATFSWQEIIR